ncbi:formyltetrahydrofolate deformylase [Vibrio penaeicida]|uniref:Formyltetrahydrofolate deformylase n=1 Tax=Vibrio penaeicida TaxID=104609 RepID=A0AAV5NYW6_9VIBR|nr:formyltetrahydrofolate deformylase [Vibrio penaeicida]RTZ22680.1 formyltetrahydrofolate deformylase [Vibrio penaeicida]GLQ75650.1 formyltetrahydrofolate deformylase [Vibrio penaeicida]
MTQHYILTASCPSRQGTVDVVTRFLYEWNAYISELSSFDDEVSGRFFIRVDFRMMEGASFDSEQFTKELNVRGSKFDLEWEVSNANHKTKVVIMVSKYDHCLNDLLYRYRTGNLNVEVGAIVSNHPDLKPLAEWHGIPYYHFPISKETKLEQEAKVEQIMEEYGCELLILARYMQVLSNGFCKRLEGKAINIHHSILPGFKGARPYHQAYEKGVKLLGATAHYVSDELDEGPIITQGMEVVNHSFYPEDLAKKGMDVESLTLAKAVQLHIQKRVFLYRNKTIVFEQ